MADYNGWANYETWCVNLWLTNEPTTDEDLTAIVKRNEESYIKADRLQEYVASLNEEILDKASLAISVPTFSASAPLAEARVTFLLSSTSWA